jgi:hypothetical protein
MAEKYVVVKLSELKKLEEIIRRGIFESTSSYSYAFSDVKHELKSVEPLFKRIRDEEGADIADIVAQLKGLNICPACEHEGQQHSCQSLGANKLGRRLKRLLDRAE